MPDDLDWSMAVFSGAKGSQADQYFTETAAQRRLHVWQGEQATIAEFTEQARLETPIPHLVSHGISVEEGQLGYLELKDGLERISYPDLFRMEVNKDLLFLGGCDSGIGLYHSGEGYLSMSRGAIFAGANNVIVAKASIETESNGLFVASFYEELWEKPLPVTYAFVVQKAQRALLNQPKSSHPYYWAGYYLEGR